MYKDKTIVCKDCGQSFTFTAREQEFFAEKGFTNEPQRCKACRDARKASHNANGNDKDGHRHMYPAVCASCGCSCEVPFEPHDDRPVYCNECFKKMKQNKGNSDK
ncbi:MAG TPA: zinc-binding protein [Erysipelotrichaceae bacterium]|nr:zinc-binding protein [Erysipelotrichaceae bacterium]